MNRSCRVLLGLAGFLPALIFGQEAKVMTWNLGGFTPIPSERIKNLAKVIANIQPDLIAVQEVTPRSNFQALVLELNQMGLAYKARHLEISNHQVLGFIAREGVGISNLRVVSGSDAGNNFLRKALVATCKIGQFDFFAMNLHLKAGRGSAERTVRTKQCVSINKYLKRAMRYKEKDMLILGDYNMVPVQDQANFDAMTSTQYPLRFVSDSLTGQASHLSPNGGGNLLEGYAISNEFTTEYIADSIQIFESNKLFDDQSIPFHIDNVSDHLPLIARFDATQDDD
ncbi:MAG: endonuclease/exonuclease/phosphatase family protein [Chlorobia bacterium]|nr:endonuclease/exonuclease/phosphatase family protein [Fimbriimonadaceae bacterium]